MSCFIFYFRRILSFFEYYLFGIKNMWHRKVESYSEKQGKPARALSYALLCAGACFCYRGALECGFVFDDISAIRENRDLRPTSPWSNLLMNDFWGTPMYKEQSHKSYRPVCVFTYRLNYLLHGLKPFGYHLVNIALHALVCLLYRRMCAIIVPERTAFVAAMLFAVHPLHTEAVTGVVGRAEILSSFFYLLAFLSYASAAFKRNSTDWFWFGCSLLFVALATFSKEQGITVVGICCVYDVFILHKLVN
ncbi:protein O-mannosyl-transferase Tmtc3-like isoform X2 [Stegodyphus dumicola]|uniref:protein O-mannosyl-transferase Tmtc3-like isoform X2 n=1 Tax=Stegodyphus dumicola TaxID=202533 RepID=UPI0015B01F28|nr:protein O-mannosyl-transferase Tmtc3-like isoform X2 [Stegodyphus dumicola]